MQQKRFLKALVVDDAAFMRTVLKDILLENGFSRIYEAKDGREAITVFKKYRPDLVTMDVIMPDTDGLQSTKAILEFDQNAKIVMVTSVGQEHIVKEAIKLGAKNYVVKPFQVSAIKSVIDRILKTG